MLHQHQPVKERQVNQVDSRGLSLEGITKGPAQRAMKVKFSDGLHDTFLALMTFHQTFSPLL